MDRLKPNGVVIVWQSSNNTLVHRPDRRGPHGEAAMKTEDWELFPSLELAVDAGYQPCAKCFHGH